MSEKAISGDLEALNFKNVQPICVNKHGCIHKSNTPCNNIIHAVRQIYTTYAPDLPDNITEVLNMETEY